MRLATMAAVVAVGAVWLPAGNQAEAGEKPWVGSYVLTLPEDEVEQMKQLGVEPPNVGFTLKDDGTFVWEEPAKERKGNGTYTMEGNKLTLTMKEIGGEAPEGPMSEPMKLEALDDFEAFSDGHGKFVRKE